jgi:hypothetical protein
MHAVEHRGPDHRPDKQETISPIEQNKEMGEKDNPTFSFGC